MAPSGACIQENAISKEVQSRVKNPLTVRVVIFRTQFYRVKLNMLSISLGENYENEKYLEN